MKFYHSKSKFPKIPIYLKIYSGKIPKFVLSTASFPFSFFPTPL